MFALTPQQQTELVAAGVPRDVVREMERLDPAARREAGLGAGEGEVIGRPAEASG